MIFRPPRRNGLLAHAAVGAPLLAVAGVSLWQASLSTLSPLFLLYLMLALVSLAFVPGVLYRAFALQRAYYAIERDGIRLHWGLRTEDIPMESVMWIGPPETLPGEIPLPWLTIPGAVLGKRRADLDLALPGEGEIEFLAASTHNLLLLATPQCTYAISPADPDAFLEAFETLGEMGSLTPIEPQSIYPTFLLSRVWSDPLARLLLLSSLLLSLALLAWVSLMIPGRDQVVLGFTPVGAPRAYVPAIRLLLLPVLNGALALADLLMGLFFYRQEETRFLSYLLWISAILTPILFSLAVFFILRAS